MDYAKNKMDPVEEWKTNYTFALTELTENHYHISKLKRKEYESEA